MKNIIKLISQTPKRQVILVALIGLLMLAIAIYVAAALKAAVPVPQILLWGPIQIRVYSLTAIAGIVTAVVLISYFKRDIPSLKTLDVLDNLIWVLITGLVGARLYHVITDYHIYASQPSLILAIQNGGLGIIGGIAGGLLGLWWVARQNKVPLVSLVSLVALAMPVAHAIGRLGNLFNRELYGLPTDLPWGLYIEPIFRVSGYYQSDYFHPLFLYEALANLILFGVLWYLWRRPQYRDKPNQRDWAIIQGYVVGYGLIRFGLDFLRVEGNTGLAGLSYAQWLLLGLLVCYLSFRIFKLWRHKTKHESKSANRR